jgi:biopolymer transport protein ExbD/biopolymer transport protein TolR
MAMDVSAPGKHNKKGRARPEMNVTPLVDVVLVLLIIFMVLTSVLADHFWLHVPEKDKQTELEPPPSDDPNDQPIVVSVNPKGQVQINQGRLPRRRVSRAPEAHAGRSRRAARLLRCRRPRAVRARG